MSSDEMDTLGPSSMLPPTSFLASRKRRRDSMIEKKTKLEGEQAKLINELELLAEEKKDIETDLTEIRQELKECRNDDLLQSRKHALALCNTTSERILSREAKLDDVSKKIEELDCKLSQQEAEDEGSLESPVRKKRRVPKSLTSSASKVEALTISLYEIRGEIFQHYFAVAMHKLLEDLSTRDLEDLSTRDTIVFQFLSETFEVNALQLEELFQAWRRIDIYTEDERIRTAYLSCLLDRFLFTKSPIGFCLHQVPLPSKHTTNYPDFCIVPNDRRFTSTDYVCVSDYKREDKEKAHTESGAYSIVGTETVGSCEKDRVRLAFACTKDMLELTLHIPVGEKFLSICVSKVSKPTRAFFCVLYAGVHYLLNNKLNECDCVIRPSEDLTLPLRDIHYELRVAGRVFRSADDKVFYKFFDTANDYLEPNLDLVKLVFPEARLTPLKGSSDQYRYLTYDYRAGTNFPRKGSEHKQFSQLCIQLSKIHAQGFVHSDIREKNIVFSNNSAEAWIIDYDLADKEDSLYPLCFNDLKERHPEAKAGKPRMKKHDVYSLDKIAMYSSVQGIYDMFCNGKSLDEIAKELLKHSTASIC